MSTVSDEPRKSAEGRNRIEHFDYRDIEPEELPGLLLEKLPVILDMRDEAAFERGHISGAVPADEEQIRQALAKRTRPVLIYCYHGHSSRDLSEFLARMGVPEVYNLNGGWHALQGSAAKTVATAVKTGTCH